ncbi:hypothetical protein N7467_012036 [Penicillium canescens]|nr:hypothetical protein N7467_012036 [Penicillium canescens]
MDSSLEHSPFHFCLFGAFILHSDAYQNFNNNVNAESDDRFSGFDDISHVRKPFLINCLFSFNAIGSL